MLYSRILRKHIMLLYTILISLKYLRIRQAVCKSLLNESHVLHSVAHCSCTQQTVRAMLILKRDTSMQWYYVGVTYLSKE